MKALERKTLIDSYERFLRSKKLQTDQRTFPDYQTDKAIHLRTKDEHKRFRGDKARNDSHRHKTADRNEAVRTHGVQRRRTSNELPLCLNPYARKRENYSM